MGRVVSKAQTVDANTFTVGYTYANGNLTTLTTPSGRAITYGYDNNRHIVSVSVNGTLVAGNITYEPFAMVNGWTWGNGSSTSRTFDADGNVTQVSSSFAKSYGYDDASRITGVTDLSADAARSWSFGYDPLDRLHSASSSGISESFTYDANDNRLTEGGTFPSAIVLTLSVIA